MPAMLPEVYDAFIASGAPEEKARAAAEAMAGHEGRFGKIEQDLAVLKWMIGFNLAATVAILMQRLSN